MNTRQLTQGLLPTVEYERNHTFKTYRQFPELRLSIDQVQNLKLSRQEVANQLSQSKGIKRTVQIKSTHRLDELSKSSLTELSSVMDDFRKILIENRRKNVMSGSSSVASQSTASLKSESAEYEGLTPLEIANKKLKKISVSFDSQSYNSHLAGFQGAKLTKNEFETLLRRCLNINLKRIELDALFDTMDADGSLLIDGVEFIRYFFQLGNEARWKMLIDTKEIQTKRKERMKHRRILEQQRIKEWEDAQIKKFSDKDYISAMVKLKDAAFNWDPSNHIDSVFTKGFEAFLSPYQFKIQIEKSFSIKLTGAEVPCSSSS
jgi:hypothetical protein